MEVVTAALLLVSYEENIDQQHLNTIVFSDRFIPTDFVILLSCFIEASAVIEQTSLRSVSEGKGRLT